MRKLVLRPHAVPTRLAAVALMRSSWRVEVSWMSNCSVSHSRWKWRALKLGSTIGAHRKCLTEKRHENQHQNQRRSWVTFGHRDHRFHGVASCRPDGHARPFEQYDACLLV